MSPRACIVRWACACCLGPLVLGLGGVPAAVAQGPPLTEDHGPVPLSIGSPGGTRTFQPNRWGTVGVEVANPTKEPVEVDAVFHFPRAPHTQFSRHLWLPPKSKRLAYCLIMMPDVDPERRSCELRSVVTRATPRGEEILRDLGGSLQRSSLLPRSIEPITSAMFADTGFVPMWAAPTHYDVIVAARLSAGLTRRIGEWGQPLLPDLPLQLESLEQLTLHNDLPFSDAATVAALRRWLFAGGKLWIFLDNVEIANVQRLLGNDFRSTIVDRVDLTEIAFQPENQNEPSSDRREFEKPIPMLRMLVEGADVRYRVDGWPAAFVQSFGHGRVLFTTVGPRAWVRPNTPADRQPNEPERRADHVALPVLQDLAATLLTATYASPVQPDDFQAYLGERIGYRIVNRPRVAVILGGFVVALAIGGTVLRRRDQGTAVAWLAPALAVVAALPIGIMGFSRQREVPRTVAQAQIVGLLSGSQSAQVDGLLAFYHQAPTDLTLESQGIGSYLPDTSGLEGSTRVLAWRDFDRWSWGSLKMPGGVRVGKMTRTTELPGPAGADATFGPQGLQGRVELPGCTGLSDASIVLPGSRGIAVQLESDGKFSAGPNDVLATGQYLGGTLLSDEQRRRQTVLGQMHARRVISGFPQRPMMVCWADPLAAAFRVPGDYLQTGSALIYLPVEIRRPAAGSKILIPSSFLPYRAVAGPTGRGAASTYQPGRDEWVAMTTASDTWLRVQVPPDLLPLTLNTLRVRLQIKAPSRQVDIAALRAGQVEVRESRKNPAGLVEFEITDGTLLRLDETGGLWLGLLVSQAFDDSRSKAEWQVQDLQLTAYGQVR